MEKKKKGGAKEWLKENWPLLVVGGFYGGLVGFSGYQAYKAYKHNKQIEAYWQTPEAWDDAAKQYEVLANQSKLVSQYYEGKNSTIDVTEF